jgi:hypothetical protein
MEFPRMFEHLIERQLEMKTDRRERKKLTADNKG